MFEEGVEDATVVLFLMIQQKFSDVGVGLVQDVVQLLLGVLLLLHRWVLAFLLLDDGWLGDVCCLFGWLHKRRDVGFLDLHLRNRSQALNGKDILLRHFLSNGFDFQAIVVLFSEVGDDGNKVAMLYLHLLMMAAALFGLPRSYEDLHSFEDFVHATHVTIHEVLVVDLQEPMVFFVLLVKPVPAVWRPRLLRGLGGRRALRVFGCFGAGVGVGG